MNIICLYLGNGYFLVLKIYFTKLARVKCNTVYNEMYITIKLETIIKLDRNQYKRDNIAYNLFLCPGLLMWEFFFKQLSL